MENVVKDVVIMDMAIYWILTIVILGGLDLYAKGKMGNTSLGYKALRIPKFAALCISSVATVIFVLSALLGLKISQTMLTYFGIPYFAVWVYYMCNVFRRVKAERVRRLDN